MKILVNTKQEKFEHEYDIVENGKWTCLHHSDSKAWSEHIRGTVAVKYKDNGDFVTIKSDRYKIELDYSQLLELQLLLSLVERPNFKVK